MTDQQLTVAACVLAAGQSSRMGKENKLLARLNGKTLLQHVLYSIQRSNIDEVLVVTGHQSEQVCESMTGFELDIIYNEYYSIGMSTSIKQGVANLGAEIEAVIIFLSDMPFISAASVNKILAEFKNDGDIVVPTFSGHDGNPVLWSRRYFNELNNLQGDYGAKSLLARYPNKVHRIDVDDVGIVLDIDDVTTLEFFRSKFNLNTRRK